MIITLNKSTGATITNVGGKMSLDVNVTDITLTAASDSIETRCLAQKIAFDEVSSTLAYYGEAATGTSGATALWRIRRITTAGTVVTVEWADGDGQFNNIWNNRAALSYS